MIEHELKQINYGIATRIKKIKKKHGMVKKNCSRRVLSIVECLDQRLIDVLVSGSKRDFFRERINRCAETGEVRLQRLHCQGSFLFYSGSDNGQFDLGK